jgi:hypothetical protein
VRVNSHITMSDHGEIEYIRDAGFTFWAAHAAQSLP